MLIDSIKQEFCNVLEASGEKLRIDLTSEAVLLETGMDSLGFAILVTQLEEKLGYDPFSLMTEPYYPKTFQEFVDVYEKYRPKS
ncbi:MAG: acyl carrier protein [Pseudomonadota bacterium]